MADNLATRIELLARQKSISQLVRFTRGIEKEGLRTTPDGELAQTPHPAGLGAALTHPYITTDYSEALVEFITPTFTTTEGALDFLDTIHRVAYTQLGDESIWAASMPCFLGGEDSIPIARYGSSNVGTLKQVYREGLKWRYGKMMQTIAGIHYNFSLAPEFWPVYQQLLGLDGDLQDFQTSQYFGLIRNFRRYSWLILYLFGASPALCSSFLQGRSHQLQTLKGRALYLPHATSLRMSDLGYQSDAQSDLYVCHNSLEQYTASLGAAVSTSYPGYEEIGVTSNGEYRQLNTNLLQIENEYYSDIRPKRVTPSGRKPLQELAERGVEYIEVRNLDINPFMPLGIDVEQIRFLDCFLLYCLLQDSPDTSRDETVLQQTNKERVVHQGRDPELELYTTADTTVKLRDLGRDLFDGLAASAALMDKAGTDDDYQQAVLRQREKLLHPELTPSAMILAELNERNVSFFEFGMNQTAAHKAVFTSNHLSAEGLACFEHLAEHSLQQQEQIETDDTLGFADFLKNYQDQ